MLLAVIPATMHAAQCIVQHARPSPPRLTGSINFLRQPLANEQSLDGQLTTTNTNLRSYLFAAGGVICSANRPHDLQKSRGAAGRHGDHGKPQPRPHRGILPGQRYKLRAAQLHRAGGGGKAPDGRKVAARPLALPGERTMLRQAAGQSFAAKRPSA